MRVTDATALAQINIEAKFEIMMRIVNIEFIQMTIRYRAYIKT